MSTHPGDLVLDPTCGSGTTAYVAEAWGRRWITIDPGAVAITWARQRLVTGVFDYWLLKDSPEGARAEAERGAAVWDDAVEYPAADATYEGDVSKDFVYERVPHVSAGRLARGDREVILLNDRPLKARGVTRVASPFTVETHAPFKFLSPAEYLEHEGAERRDAERRITDTIVRALEVNKIRSRDAGPIDISDIDRIVALPGAGGGLTHRAKSAHFGGEVGLAILPPTVTVPRERVNAAWRAALEDPAMKAVIVIGFAFEGDNYEGRQHVETERRGRLDIVRVEANRDLQIPELDHAENAQAFVELGELAVEILDAATGKAVAPEDLGRQGGDIRVRIVGLDSFDVKTGNVRSVDDPASALVCWMLDSDHDGERFNAHYIHFPRGRNDRQVKRYRAAVGSKLSREEWHAMLTCESASFPRPRHGRSLAVRAITTTHTEVQKVLRVPAS